MDPITFLAIVVSAGAALVGGIEAERRQDEYEKEESKGNRSSNDND